MSFQTQWHVLPPQQYRMLPLLTPLAALGLVLYGGTAVALRLGHRQSVHFDFFTETSLDKTALRQVIPALERGQTIQETPNGWTLLLPTEAAGEAAVRLSFFGGISTGRVGQPEFTDDDNLLVASPVDLLAFKLNVIMQRIEAKDYCDIAALMAGGQDLGRGLSAARTLFGSAFQPMECLKALVYFDGGDLISLSAAQRTLLVQAAGRAGKLPVMPLASGQLGCQPQAKKQ